MKFSELWLREWVNPPISTEELSHQMTMAGLEVDGIKPVACSFNGVIVGEVIKCSQHTNDDKLYITQVNIGDNRLLDIVCGALNCRAGLKVAVAKVGAILPDNCKINATQLHGKLSEGILCSFFELGISENHNSIIELPKNAPIGIDIRDYLKLNDNIFEINITPNRADCLSIIGIARDIAMLNQMTVTKPDISPVTATIHTTLPIRVDTPQICPRYLGRVVKGINIKVSSPLWMREKLRRCGMRSIDALVDIGNYVLLELGQPIHSFDLNLIEGGIVVRMAEDGEVLTLLNGNKITLHSDTLVISDHYKALAIGGICGGEYSGVNNETKDILLECALFNPTSIIGNAHRQGLQSDTSRRYEHGVDPEIQYKSLDRATRLILDICGGQAGPVIDVTDGNELPQRATIRLHRKKLDRLLGHIVPRKKVSKILLRLGCQVTDDSETWLVIAPSWRFDIKIEEDLVEEIIRVYGYNNIPNVPVRANLVMTKHPETNLTLTRVKTLLVDHGFQEVVTYSFVDPQLQELLHPGEEALILPNPISTEMSVMRLSLWTGLLSTTVYNQNRQQSHLRFFESGLRFVPDSSANLSIRQDTMLAGVISGYIHDEHWDLGCKSIDFYDLKGELESILELTGKLSAIQFLAIVNPALHPGQGAAIYLYDECIGYIGALHPELERKLGLNGRTFVFELQWSKVERRSLPQMQEISRFPANRRDISIVVAESISAADILAECKKVGVNQVVGVNLFDVYRGKGIAEGYKSLSISLILQNIAYTLEEEEIAATIKKCVEALRQRFQASLRN